MFENDTTKSAREANAAFKMAWSTARDIYESGKFETLEELYSNWKSEIDKHDFTPVSIHAALNGDFGVTLFVGSSLAASAKVLSAKTAIINIENIGVPKFRRYANIQGIAIPEVTIGDWKREEMTVYSWNEGIDAVVEVLKRAKSGGTFADEEINIMVYRHLARVIAKTINPAIKCSRYDFLVAQCIENCGIDITCGIAFPRVINIKGVRQSDRHYAEGYFFQAAWEIVTGKKPGAVNIVTDVTRYQFPKGSGGPEHYYAKTQARVKIPFTALFSDPAMIVKRDREYGKGKYRFESVDQIEAVRNVIESSDEFSSFYRKMEAKVKAILAEV